MPYNSQTLLEFLNTKRDYFIPLSMRDDREDLVKRAWKAKSGGKANDDFLINPPLKKDGTPINSVHIKKQYAYIAQFIRSAKRQFGAKAINEVLNFIEEVRNEEIQNRKQTNIRIEIKK